MVARVIALTGAIGSGKSTVLALAAQMPDVVTLSADALVHDILANPEHPVVVSIVQRFGSDVLGARGVDRPKLARRVFGDADARTYLEGQLHPAVRELMMQRIAAAMDTARVILVEVPLLFETNLHLMFPETWAVLLDADTRAVRVQARDGLSLQDFSARNSLQVDDATRRALATHLLYNHGDTVDLKKQVSDLLALK